MLKTLKELVRRRHSNDEPLVGAAIGIGMTATAAERGGADFLLALNAGRYRVMGAASIAALLPLDDANRFTDSFARREILDQVRIPVFFGASRFNPALDPAGFMAEIAAAGYSGVANFPTVNHFDGAFRRALEEAGLGYAREVEMLRQAKRQGLLTFGYAKSRTEIQQAIDAEIDIICLNFGWNAGGSRGLAQAFTIEEAADRARRILGHVRQARPETICVVEGGPIVNPDDMYRVCRGAKADGYVGGSTLDRLPLELSVTQVTSAFKAVNALREADETHSKEVARAARLGGIAGQSDAATALLKQLVRLSPTNLPVLIVGESGLGRTILARAAHALSGRRGSAVVFDARHSESDHEEFLFGSESAFGRIRRNGALEAVDGTVIIQDADCLSAAAQARLADWLERRVFERVGGERPVEGAARLIAITTPPGTERPGLLPEMLRHLGASRLDIVPLRDRPEDIAPHARMVLEAIGLARGRARALSADGIRALFAHAWPENTRELRRVVEKAAMLAKGTVLGAAEIAAALGSPREGTAIRPPMAEKDCILDALRRNSFRRGQAAQFLGISRKTLYNKKRRHGLLE